jgi:hypothetical protein
MGIDVFMIEGSQNKFVYVCNTTNKPISFVFDGDITVAQDFLRFVDVDIRTISDYILMSYWNDYSKELEFGGRE